MKRTAAITLAAVAASSLAGTASAAANQLDFFADPKDVAPKQQQSPIPHSSAGHCPPADVDALDAAGMLHSQDGQDKCLLQHYFPGVCGGRYMEVGALDGNRFSNTYAFYNAPQLGWRGVNIEVDPTSYANLSKNRVNDIANVHAAVCSEESTVHYVPGRFKAVGGIWEFSTPEQRERWWPGMDSPDAEGATPVRCTQLQNILDSAIGGEEYHYFDFMTLDIEGAELSALQGLDFGRVGFGVIIIEKQERGRGQYDKGEEGGGVDGEIRRLLESVGYDRVDDKEKTCGFRDHWFVNRQVREIYAEVGESRVKAVRNLRG